MISSFPTNSSTTFDVMEETTFGVIDGQIMQRSKSTDALYQPLPLSSSSTLTTPTTKTVFTPRTIDRM
uniref:Uncharacterized protein n=1 Tax=Panagrolaimus sp. PS1159 TaxID=55785 RepID=A0AC35G3L7_9BILA